MQRFSKRIGAVVALVLMGGASFAAEDPRASLTWSRTVLVAPSKIDPDLEADAMEEAGRRNGLPETLIASQKAAARASAIERNRGMRLSSRVNLESDGRAVRSETENFTKGRSTGILVDFYDGKLVLSAEKAPKDRALEGRVAPNGNDALRYTRSTDAELCFLAAVPVDRYFPREGCEVVRQDAKTITLLRKRELTWGFPPLPVSAQMTVDRKTGAPLALAMRHGEFLYSVTAGRRADVGGRNVPTLVTIKMSPHADRPPKTAAVWTLEKAAFGAKADLTALKEGVARGTVLHDSRLGKPVTYVVRDGIPTDEAVAALAREVGFDDEDRSGASKAGFATYASWIGLGAILSALTILTVAHRRRRTTNP